MLKSMYQAAHGTLFLTNSMVYGHAHLKRSITIICKKLLQGDV